MHQDYNKQFRVTALREVITYVEAPDLTAAGVQAQWECARDRVKLLRVEDITLPAIPPPTSLAAAMDGHI
jgi:hypothetical protein